MRQQKRPTLEAKETYSGGKRDLLWRQKRPTLEAKETYTGGKRDLNPNPTCSLLSSSSEARLLNTKMHVACLGFRV